MEPDREDLTVVLIEDDGEIASQVVIGLRRNGMRVSHVVTGREGIRAAQDADLVLLDLELPDLDGTEVCRRIRARSSVPIIVLSARAEEADRVSALDLGADDYLVKPYGLRELTARIHAVLRRSDSGGQVVVRAGDVVLDRRTRQAHIAGAPLRLTAKEFDLLALLMEEPGTVYSRKRLLDHVWGREWYGAGRTLDVHVASLRKKLGDPELIETIRGIGFRLGLSQ